MIILIGCFGNHPFDRAMENELNRYLNSLDDYECRKCGEITKEWDLDVRINEDDNSEYWLCKCGHENNL